ncbi:hypothetical protein PLESTB_001617100 [Pleodorina starrii]|uniref:Reverse transcriptase domain-containing protein n=1 Tax=Pleodorina starrii TaxID=330485 RepID=A0A9W6BZP6_9CHLO|nr:hypothetical protein PLESTB_001617100 [Pleodorina starrii]
MLAFINRAHGNGAWWNVMGWEERNRRQAAADAALNIPIAVEEVTSVLEDLPNGKSSGPEKVCGECYKYARQLRNSDDDRPEINRLAPVLQALMEHIRSKGDFPEQFTVSDLVPVYKRNGRDPTDCSNYRGIAVGGVLAKCYASVLERRLTKFAEADPVELPVRHWCQAGFRQGLGTQHHLFMLRHILNRYARPGQSGLLVCQIDFEKAFDRVDRKTLWARLAERGVGGQMMDALRRAYDNVELRVKVNGQRGTPFKSDQGVKQGCPLSPVLFGMFIETFANYVDERDQRWPQGGSPIVGGKRVPELLYADDLTLFATNPARMQFLLDRLVEYCEGFGMSLNVNKCELLVFAGRQDTLATLMEGASQLRFAGQPVPVKERAKYLGLRYGPSFSFDSCRMELCDVGRRAVFALMQKLDRNRIWVPDLMLRCFDVQIRSLLSYGAEVWGPDAIREALGTMGRQRIKEWHRWGQSPGSAPAGENGVLLKKWGKWVKSVGRAAGVFERCMADPMVEVQRIFLRKVVGASLPPNRQLFAETSQLPLHYFWARQVFGIWKRVARQSTSLARAVLEENIKSWLETDHSATHEYFWAGKVLRIFETLGFDYRQHVPVGLNNEEKAKAILGLKIPFDNLLAAEFRRRLLLDWSSGSLDRDPRNFPEYEEGGVGRGAPGVTACRYLKWMGVAYSYSDHKRTLDHLKVCMPRKHHTALMRFRLGRWDLDVSRFARGPGRKPRAERICRVCHGGSVEDELHVLMECPGYTPLREATGFPMGSSMVDVMGTFDSAKLGSLLSQIQKARIELLGS